MACTTVHRYETTYTLSVTLRRRPDHPAPAKAELRGEVNEWMHADGYLAAPVLLQALTAALKTIGVAPVEGPSVAAKIASKQRKK